ncbi:hypothetical protein [Tautonia marina]|uniref:hypothetical protein n=1 Tax=Tautonia marina TaxID=2653855 RepID=UPI001260E6FC|nr:hypothetical protein [Tautonia marina]
MAQNQAAQPDRGEDRDSVPLLDFLAEAITGVMSDRSVAAMGREAVKDVRDTVHQVFFGQHERGGEIGAPMNPLASEIANDNVLHAMTERESGQTLPSPSQIAASNGQAMQAEAAEMPSPSHIAGNGWGPAQGKGEFQQAGWVDYILGRGKNETPYDRDQQHIKPEDEKEQRKGQEQEQKQPERDNDRNNSGRGGGGRC